MPKPRGRVISDGTLRTIACVLRRHTVVKADGEDERNLRDDMKRALTKLTGELPSGEEVPSPHQKQGPLREVLMFQACTFRREEGSKPEHGVARLTYDFNCYDVRWIVDRSGRVVKKLWDYNLILAHGSTMRFGEGE